MLFSIDWHQMLVPSTGILELIIRGSVMYLFIFALLRLFRREQGSLNTADLLVLLLVADAAQNGMAGEYTSVPEGVVLVTTIIGWNYLLDWLGYHIPAIGRLLAPAPVSLVVNGRVRVDNLRSQMLSRDDLMRQLREQGIDRLSEVKRCAIESDGRISVIRYPSGREEVHVDPQRGRGGQ